MKVMVDRQYPIGVDRLYEILTSKVGHLLVTFILLN